MQYANPGNHNKNNNTRRAKWKIKDICYDSIYHLNEQIDPQILMKNYMHIENNVERDYKAFQDYIKNAYDTASKKESVGANFKKIEKNNEFKLEEKWFIISIVTKIIQNKYESDQTKISTLKEYGLEIKDIVVNDIFVNGKSIEFILDNGNYYIKGISSDSIVIINNNSEIKASINQLISNSVTYNNNIYSVVNGKVWIENYISDECYDSNHPFIKYHISKADGTRSKDTIVLELEDDDSSDISVFDVFFNEDVESIYLNNNKRSTFDVKEKIKEYGHLVIKTDKPELFSNGGKLFVSTNQYQLKCQKNAIDILINRPSEYHKPLLVLGDNIEKSHLEKFKSIRELEHDQFKVLTNQKLKGNKIQQDFINKSLNTPDFMILEGPPGSGKTTTILEFIYQALKEGKKILLCASTHVAIDNVLEKIIKHPERDEILKYINPVRIGDENNIYVPEVQKYTYDNIMRNISNDKYKNITEDSFNLVCGTTIGILRYPKFKEALDRDNDSQSIEPIFDYMIIDEASKTTFNEFLVPAVFAKKWIIVGDVKQLAPYVERNDLTPTLVTSKSLENKEIRKAIHFLTMIEHSNQKNKMKNNVFVMSNSSIDYIDSYILEKDIDGIVAISNKGLRRLFNINQKEIELKNYHLTSLGISNQIIIAEEGLLKNCLNYLSSIYNIIGNDQNLTHLNYYSDYKIMHHRKENYHQQKAVTELFDDYSRKLEDEIIWRLIRIYELTNNDKSKKEGYEKFILSIKKYLDKDMIEDYDDTIAMLEEIALPSIIMLLQNGIKKKSNNKKSTILNSGLSEADKENRFLTLQYQYRMHKDISQIPRKYIYDDKALNDDVRTYDNFEYITNASRFEIRNIICDNVEKNKNENEAQSILDELDTYLNSNPKKDTKIAILTFYNGQVFLLRQKLQKYFKSSNKYNFYKNGIDISLNTVDKFQGQEADVVYLSMVQNHRVGFLDSVNRMNVSITRAKDKLIIFGNVKFFQEQKDSELLRNIFKESNSGRNSNESNY